MRSLSRRWAISRPSPARSRWRCWSFRSWCAPPRTCSARARPAARGRDRARPAALAGHPPRRLPGGASGPHHRPAAGGRPRQRRDRAAAVHRSEQPVLEHQSQRADGQPAGRDLPVRAVALQGMAAARLDRRADHHPGRARLFRSRRASSARKGPANDRLRFAIFSSRLAYASAAPHGKLAEKMAVRNLDFFYGDNRALEDRSACRSTPIKVTAFIGPSGCGKSTLLRVLNRMYDLYPHQRAEGEVLLDGENILDPEQDVNVLRARVGMVFQKPTPFPDVDLREYRLRHPALRKARQGRDGRAGRKGAARRRDLGRSEGQAATPAA